MSCGCSTPDPNPCDPNITSPEAVSSQLTNLTRQLFGVVTKSIVDGRFVWDTPCSASLPFNIYGVVPAEGEGMLCYIIRAIKAVPGAAVNGTIVFANSAARASSAPNIIGQIGLQEDELSLYVAVGTSAGNWAPFNLLLGNIPDGLFTADAAGRAKFAAGFISTAELATAAVTALKIADGSISTAKIINGAVATAKLGDGSVTTIKVADSAITGVKLATSLDLSGKTLTMPTGHWRSIAQAGAVLQTIQATYATYASLSPTIPADDTLPQNTEGTQIISQAITPTSTANKVRCSFQCFASPSGTNKYLTAALFDGGTSAIRATASYVASNAGVVVFDFLASPATTSAKTYTVRVGSDNTNILVNGSSVSRLFGGIAGATLTLQEIKG